MSEMITEVENVKGGMPNIFSLQQNCQKPFYPTTEIKYSKNNDGMVSQKVYDILGQEVATLVNKVQTPGLYEVDFNAQNLTSGIYFSRLTAGSFPNPRDYFCSNKYHFSSYNLHPPSVRHHPNRPLILLELMQKRESVFIIRQFSGQP